ncbi:MAG: glyoxalase [Ferruginibacter sp.]
MLGFELTTMYGNQAAFISAGGYHHHIGLNTWHSKGLPHGACKQCWLIPYSHLVSYKKRPCYYIQPFTLCLLPFNRASDHGVSEALYLNDPDENGVELYWDRPKELWAYKEDGTIDMFTKALDLDDLLKEI